MTVESRRGHRQSRIRKSHRVPEDLREVLVELPNRPEGLRRVEADEPVAAFPDRGKTIGRRHRDGDDQLARVVKLNDLEDEEVARLLRKHSRPTPHAAACDKFDIDMGKS